MNDLPCLLRSLSLMMCLCKALAMALDSLGLSNRAGMVTGSGGASYRPNQHTSYTLQHRNEKPNIYRILHYLYKR